jgi:hypothetical protein
MIGEPDEKSISGNRQKLTQRCKSIREAAEI